MTHTWPSEIEAILSIGRPLDETGVRNWALDHEAAIRALAHLSAAGIPVLGGDVYVEKDSRLTLTYDNWHCNRKTGESRVEFAVRSAEFARDYITHYNPGPFRVLFALVPEPTTK